MPLFLGRLQGCRLPPLLPSSTVRPQKEEAALLPSSICQHESSHAYAQSSRPLQEHSSFSFCLSPQLPRRSDATSFPSLSPSLLSPPIPHLHQKTPYPKPIKSPAKKQSSTHTNSRKEMCTTVPRSMMPPCLLPGIHMVGGFYSNSKLKNRSP